MTEKFNSTNKLQTHLTRISKHDYYYSGKIEKSQNSENYPDDNIFHLRIPHLRIAIKDNAKRWPSGRIPYTISEKFNDNQKAQILKAIGDYKTKTCITFEQKNIKDRDYVLITPGSGCSSPVGRVGGAQNVTLGTGCFNHATILHELMHSVGFEHEHNRPDRDDYIIIYWNNIKKGENQAFRKRTWDNVVDLGFSYDPYSVMQYVSDAFSKNGKPTMESKDKSIILGPKGGFSLSDIEKINKLYNCTENSNSIIDINVINDGAIQISIDTTQEQTSAKPIETQKSQCESQLLWTKMSASNTNIIIGGYDFNGTDFYICRSLFTYGETIPGQMSTKNTQHSSCIVTYSGREYSQQKYQLLTNPKMIPLFWKYAAIGDILMDNAIIGGETTNPGTNGKLYIGRCLLDNGVSQSWVIAKVKADNYGKLSSAFASYDGKEIKCEYYQILTCG